VTNVGPSCIGTLLRMSVFGFALSRPSIVHTWSSTYWSEPAASRRSHPSASSKREVEREPIGGAPFLRELRAFGDHGGYVAHHPSHVSKDTGGSARSSGR